MAAQYQQYSYWTPVAGQSYEQGYGQSYGQQSTWEQPGKITSQNQPLIHEFSVSDNVDSHPTFKQRWFGGLPFTLRAFAILSTCILLINIGWFAWAMQRYGDTNGYGTIQQGDCTATKSLNTWLHLVINVLSTSLILSSTAFMQLVNSPSREEIEIAHRQHKWMTIGILSPRNLLRVSRQKSLLCIILALSSFPFHLLYNSVVFASLSANEYYWAVTTEGFLTGDSFNLTDSNAGIDLGLPVVGPINSSLSGDPTEQYWTNAFQQIQQNALTYDHLDIATCLKTYTNRLIVDRRNLLLISPEKNTSNSILAFNMAKIDNEGDIDPLDWICSTDPGRSGDSCDPTPYLEDPSSWKVFGHTVEYCLSEQAPGSCAVQFSFGIALSVIICNAIKVLAMFYILWKIDIPTTVTCHGDAIAWFLTREDQHTHNMSTTSRRNFLSNGWFMPQRNAPSRRWASAASGKRWVLTILTMLVAIVLVLILLGMALPNLSDKSYSTSFSSLWNLGFGTVNPQVLAASDNFGTATTLALLANLPQLILACIYLVYNSLFRLMFAAQDYSFFGFKSQYLMVSKPVGKQRGTWFLGFPFAWGLPLLLLQTLLHWFVSQSFFVVQISVFDTTGSLDPSEFASVSNCGYSPIAMIFSMIAAGIMAVLTIGLGLRKFKDGSPPVVGGCSAAIAAACHPPDRTRDMVLGKLIWNWRVFGPGDVRGFIGPAEGI